ncbi:ATP-binding protein [Paenibacillus woosongensis]|uniref:ATP-binding protein n=1 Tax=Paenibacillus woosongensis TaxID=307580 RepID=A0AA95I790_9BACL|nr:ATP-binding protein [Paenibacillus woosongensis]WHX47912.1 ATP-binding protein [Paenibacillus woosongensis]
MKIKSIQLKGWRSYSNTEGIELKNFKKINIIIGQNNSGKSNLFKYLFRIREMINNAKPQHERKDELGAYDLLNCLPTSIAIQDTWAENGADIHCNIQLDQIKELEQGIEATLHLIKNINLSSHHKIDDQKTCFSIEYENEKYLIEKFIQTNPKILNPNTGEYVNPVEGIGYPKETVIYWKMFADSLVFVDPIRHYSRGSSEPSESDFDGSNIVQEIITLHNEENAKWRQFQKQLEDWLKIILLEPQFHLDPTNEKLRFFLKRGDKEVAAFLENLGTGVSQLIMLLSFLYLNRSRILNVFIEEPESNLHPEAVVQLMKILEENFENHRFFVSTHSSVLIDQLNENWSIHRVIRKEEKPSTILPCTEVVDYYKVLDELGIRPSQLLQSNIVIWVEGPSDRIYLKKWITDNNPYLLEGKHFSFLMYGGANIASYDLIDDKDYINILKTSRYSVIVCDSDKKKEDDPVKERVKKLIERLNAENSLKHYVYIWITSGREIENYIPGELFEQVLFDQFRREFIYVKDETAKRDKIALSFTLDASSLGLYDSFDVFYANKYHLIDGRPLEHSKIIDISNDLSKKKVQIATSIVEKWETKHYDNGTDLKEKLADIIEHIKRANYFGDH